MLEIIALSATVSHDYGNYGIHFHIFVSLIWSLSLSMMYDWASLDHVIVCDKLSVSWSLGPLCPPHPDCLLVSGLRLPDVRNAGLTGSHPPPWPHTDLTLLSANSIHLPTSQIRWQLSVCVNLRVIRTMKIFLSHNQHWDPITKFTTRIISLYSELLHFLGFPQLSPALQ